MIVHKLFIIQYYISSHEHEVCLQCSFEIG